MSRGARKETQLSLPKTRTASRILNPATGISWEVKSRATHCVATGEAFAEGDAVYSRLIDTLDGLIREDYSRTAWTPQLRDAALFHWKTRFRKPAPRKEPPFQEENAENFLRALLEEEDTAAANTIFILAVMLERKRILAERAVQRDPGGQVVRIYEHKDTGETFFIVDPQLTLRDIEAVQQEVALRLGWIQPAEDAAPE